MTRYANTTSVSCTKTRQDIENCLIKYQATGFAYGWQENAALISFAIKDRRVKFVLPLPDKSSREFTHSSRGRRTPELIESSYEQACR